MKKSSEKPAVAFFGLGTMGMGMAQWLLRAGYPLSVYNRSADKAKPLADAGARVASSPRETATGASLVISMVSDDKASRGMWLGEDGALAGVKKGAVLVECSTLTVAWVHELAAAAKARGCELLDAPVTGSRAQAVNGELNFLVGGSAAAFKKAMPALAIMGASAVHLGPSGSGALLKLINNFLCAVQMVSLAETVALIENSGLDRDKALAVLQNGAPGSPLIKGMPSRMISRDYTPNFQMRLMAKDLEYAIEEAARNKLPLNMALAALEAFKKGIQSGRGDQDFSAVVEEYRKR